MVIKTETDVFSELRIYPGNGARRVRADGKVIIFGTAKTDSLTAQRKKPAKLTWTQAWRRLNKKVNTEATSKKRNRRTGKVQRAIVGMDLEALKKKKQPAKTAAQEAALKEKRAERRNKKKAARADGGAAKGGKAVKNVAGKGR